MGLSEPPHLPLLSARHRRRSLTASRRPCLAARVSQSTAVQLLSSSSPSPASCTLKLVASVAPLKWLLESGSGGNKEQKRPLLQDPLNYRPALEEREASASVSRKRMDQALARGFTFVPYFCPQLSAPVTRLKFGSLLPLGV